MNNVRTIILQAADQIEKYPQTFRFTCVTIPERDGDCNGDQGCALGWIAHFHYKAIGQSIPFFSKFTDVLPVLGYDPMHLHIASHDFYDRMNTLGGKWFNSANLCAEYLRKYADKYHPAPKPLLQWLMDIIPGTGQGQVFNFAKESADAAV